MTRATLSPRPAGPSAARRALETVERRPALTYALASALLLVLAYRGFLFNERLDGFDWGKDAFYLEYLKAALEGGHLPETFMVVPQEIAWYPALDYSRSYWANGEVLSLSPFALLLPLVSVPVFVKLYLAAHLAVAVFGIWLLVRRLGHGLAAALVAVVLLLVMPWLMQHLALGYVPWVTACYAPLLAAALIRRPLRVRDVALATGLNALILYEGGTHVFMWLNAAALFLALAASARRRDWLPLRSVAFLFAGTALLVAPRAVATLDAYAGLDQPLAGTYSSLGDLWGLVTDRDADVFGARSVNEGIYGTNFYDASLGVGTVWAGLLVAALFLLVLRSRRGGWRSFASWDLAAVALLFLVLGWSGVWEALVDVLEPLGTERYAVRFLAVAAMLLGLLMAIELTAGARWSRSSALPLVIVMTVLGVQFLDRTGDFAEQGASQRYQPLLPDIEASIKSTVGAEPAGGGPPLASSASINGLVVRASGPAGPTPRCVRLPWLQSRHLSAFELNGASAGRAAPNEAAVVCADRAGTQIELSGKTYGRYRWLALAAIAYLALLFALRRFGRMSL